MIRNVVSEGMLDEAALGNHRGLTALAKRKTGDEKDVMMRAADMMKKGQVKDLNMFMKAMDQSTHKAIMPFVDKKHHKALHEDIEELMKLKMLIKQSFIESLIQQRILIKVLLLSRKPLMLVMLKLER